MAKGHVESRVTPGPWEYLHNDGVVVTQESDWGAREIGWSDADYRLIAAAPDLLSALKLVLPLAERYLAKAPTDPDNAILEDARAAIVKAEGR